MIRQKTPVVVPRARLETERERAVREREGTSTLLLHVPEHGGIMYVGEGGGRIRRDLDPRGLRKLEANVGEGGG